MKIEKVEEIEDENEIRCAGAGVSVLSLLLLVNKAK